MDYENNTNRMDLDQILDEMIRLFGNDVWNYAFSLTRRTDVADDITQEVFIKAYEKWSTFRKESSPKTWLLKITRNVTYDYHRSSFIRKVILVGKMNKDDISPSAEQEVMESLVKNEIWQCVLKLPTKFREILILFAHHELSINEISELLGISVGTVKSRLNRARVKMNSHFKEDIENGNTQLGKGTYTSTTTRI